MPKHEVGATNQPSRRAQPRVPLHKRTHRRIPRHARRGVPQALKDLGAVTLGAIALYSLLFLAAC